MAPFSGPFLMKRQILAILGLTLAALSALGARATIAADAPPKASAIAPAAVALPGTEHWSLRSDRLSAMPMTPRAKVVPISEMPNERRSVRIVYHGYGEVDLIKTER